jgi:hypothetical protein
VDDRTWYLAVGTLGAAVFVSVLDAVAGTSFDTPSGFYPFLGAVLGFLGGVMAFRIERRNGNGAPDDPS